MAPSLHWLRVLVPTVCRFSYFTIYGLPDPTAAFQLTSCWRVFIVSGWFVVKFLATPAGALFVRLLEAACIISYIASTFSRGVLARFQCLCLRATYANRCTLPQPNGLFWGLRPASFYVRCCCCAGHVFVFFPYHAWWCIHARVFRP